MKLHLKRYKLELAITVVFLIPYLFIAFYFNGTGIEADSINHYLYAKYAPVQWELYFNHWAKPVFTLLASPFAQFGLIGVKLFNVMCGLASCIFLYFISKELNLKNPILAPLLYFMLPISFVTMASGLTEPLFATSICYSIYLLLKEKYIISSILLSFIPFIRSEGLVLLGIFALFFLYKKQWKALFLIGFGHLFFSVLGFFYFKDFLWVFNKIPYASLNSPYGSGSIFHFADKLIYMMGIPLLILFCLGIVASVIHLIKRKQKKSEFFILILGLFLSFFIAHSLFWYLGIFNSMGLKRVFAAITPLMAIISLLGFNLVELLPSKKIMFPVKLLAILYILIFPFTSNPAAVEWGDLNLSDAQKNALEVSQFVIREELKPTRYFYNDPYLGETLNINPFDENKRLTLALEGLPIFSNGDLIIWDNWHSVVDMGVKKSDLELDRLKEIKSFKKGTSIYTLYLYQ